MSHQWISFQKQAHNDRIQSVGFWSGSFGGMRSGWRGSKDKKKKNLNVLKSREH